MTWAVSFWLCLPVWGIVDEALEELALMEIVTDWVVVVLMWCVHQLLKVVIVGFHLMLGRAGDCGDLVSIAS